MKNKEVWKTVGISAVTSIVVFFILGQVFGAPLFSPSWSNKQAYPSLQGASDPVQYTEINANRCQADDVCEVNSLSASFYDDQGDDGYQYDFSTTPDQINLVSVGYEDGEEEFTDRVRLQTAPYNKLEFTRSGDGTSREAKASLIGGSNPSIFFQVGEGLTEEAHARYDIDSVVFFSTAAPNGLAAEFSSNFIKSMGLSGSGQAYACISEDGTIIRSQTPCA
jgi:hypothetical protein